MPNWIEDTLTRILRIGEAQSRELGKIDEKLDIIQQELTILEGQVLQLVSDVSPGPAVSFTATVTLNSQLPQLPQSQSQSQGEETMPFAKKAARATADLSVADNGTFTTTLNFMDADQIPEAAGFIPPGLVATYTASDATPGPSALTLVPASSGISAAGSVNQTTIQALVAAGSPLPTGLTVSITANWTGLAAPLTVVAAPAIDIVAGPASSFVAVESTP